MSDVTSSERDKLTLNNKRGINYVLRRTHDVEDGQYEKEVVKYPVDFLSGKGPYRDAISEQADDADDEDENPFGEPLEPVEFMRDDRRTDDAEVDVIAADIRRIVHTEAVSGSALPLLLVFLHRRRRENIYHVFIPA